MEGSKDERKSRQITKIDVLVEGVRFSLVQMERFFAGSMHEGGTGVSRKVHCMFCMTIPLYVYVWVCVPQDTMEINRLSASRHLWRCHDFISVSPENKRSLSSVDRPAVANTLATAQTYNSSVHRLKKCWLGLFAHY